MTKRVGIFGTSGMAMESRDVASELGYDVVFVARDQTELASCDGREEVILESEIHRHKGLGFAIGVGDGAVRRKIAAHYAGIINFINLIHPDASFGHHQRARIESKQGVIICAGVRLTSNIAVGDFTIFNLNSTVSHDSIINDFATISPQACILGNVEIGNGAWIGAGAVINQGLNGSKREIGANTVIGSGAVVVDDCEADSVYVGVPARKIR